MERLALMTEIPTKSDLLAACRSGDREAMHELYVENQRRVFSIALNFFDGDRDRAEDVTQQVFVKLLKNIGFSGRSEFSTWLYRLTVNQCIDETRKSRRLISFGDWFTPAEPVVRMSLNEGVDSHQLSNEVRAVIASLKPRYRMPILLRYLEELSYEQIANVLEISIGTVSSRINRGHKMLAAKLGHLRGQI
jgi:RNA polymerase sigma-70 factor (ECF subfamily)